MAAEALIAVTFGSESHFRLGIDDAIQLFQFYKRLAYLDTFDFISREFAKQSMVSECIEVFPVLASCKLDTCSPTNLSHIPGKIKSAYLGKR